MPPHVAATAERSTAEFSETISDEKVLLSPDRPPYAPTPLNPSKTMVETAPDGSLEQPYPVATMLRLDRQQQAQISQLDVPEDISKLVAETIYAVHARRVNANDHKRPRIERGDLTNTKRYYRARTGEATPEDLIQLLANTGHESTAPEDQDFRSVELTKLTHVGDRNTTAMEDAVLETILELADEFPEALAELDEDEKHPKLKTKRPLFKKRLLKQPYGEHKEALEPETLRAINVVVKEPIAKLALTQTLTVVRRQSYTVQLHDESALPNGLKAVAQSRAQAYLEWDRLNSNDERELHARVCAQYDDVILDYIEAACAAETDELPTWLLPTTTSMYARLDAQKGE